MKKQTVCILFGGISPEHEVSLRSAECILTNIDKEKYHVLPVGITREGEWILYAGTDYSALPQKTWQNHPGNRPAAISPVRGHGLLVFEEDGVVHQHIDVVFPVLHGENGEDGTVQGLLQLAGIPCVGPHVTASAVSMDKSMTKLVADQAKVRQAAWELVTAAAFANKADAIMDRIEDQFTYPVFVKPAGTGSSVGVSKAKDRDSLREALIEALRFDKKVLVEEFIDGHEVEVAVLGNDSPVASVCGEIDAGAEFYSYDAKYTLDDGAELRAPALLTDDEIARVHAIASKAYKALGCKGMSRVDFFLKPDGTYILNEINTIPGFTKISMFPRLMGLSGISYSTLVDKLIQLSLEK